MSVARHTAYNVVGAIVPLAVSLVTVPIYLRIIGLDRYGILAICWLLVGYFKLFDFGLGRAMAQKIATLADAPWEQRNRIFWTGGLLSLLLSGLAIGVFVPLGAIGLDHMKLSDAGLRQEVNIALPLLIAAVPFGVIQSLLVGALEGRREFLKLNLILSAGSIGTAVLPLLTAVLIDPQVSNLLAASLLARLVVLMLLLGVCINSLPVRRLKIASSAEIRQLLRFGGWTTVTNIVGPLLVFIDRFAIAAVLSAAAVALYVVPFNLVAQLTVLPAALAAALMPRLAAASDAEASLVSADGLRVLTFFITPLTLAMIVGAGPFLTIWLGGAESVASIPVAYILLLGFWSNALARIPFVRLQASGRPDLIAKAHLAELVPYIGLLYLGLYQFGIAGAALAWSARTVADALILYVAANFDRRHLRTLLLHALVVISAVAIAFTTPVWSPLRWVALLSILILTLAVTLRNAPPQVGETIITILRRTKRRPTTEPS
ncbi:MAG: oligosaccharide flippase family protein [Pseudomonadota bacterium]|nr:oligosaccharide flippase family protein [Pseudomonadota bacterium]